MEDASRIEKIDVSLGRKLAFHRDEPVAKTADKAGKLGDQEPLYIAAAALAICGLLSRRPRLGWAGLSMLAAVGVADASKNLTKRLVSRTRPHVLIEENRYHMKAGGSEEKTEQSFPSGHVAGCVAAARAISRTYPEAGALGGIGATGIGVSRVLKGAHWPLDVAAGAVIGFLAEAFTHAVTQFAVRRFSKRLRRG